MPDWSIAYLVPAIVVLVRLWRIPAIRAKALGQVKRGPAWLQTVLPLVLAIVGTLIDWSVSGLPGKAPEDLAGTAGWIWIGSIGTWHAAKRILPAIWTYVGNLIAAVKIGIVGLVLVAGCANLQPPPVGQESQAQRAIDLATSVIVVTDRALAVAIETDDDFEAYAPAVLRLKYASETLRKAGATAEDACQALTVLVPVASAISCQECGDLGRAAISVVCPIGGAK